MKALKLSYILPGQIRQLFKKLNGPAIFQYDGNVVTLHTELAANGYARRYEQKEDGDWYSCDALEIKGTVIAVYRVTKSEASVYLIESDDKQYNGFGTEF